MRFNVWGSSDAGPSRQQDTPATAAAAEGSAAVGAAASSSASTTTPASAPVASASSTPAAADKAATPAVAAAPTPESLAALSRYERTLAAEEKYQDDQFPTPDEVPSCMRLFDDFLMCYTLMPQFRNIYRHGELRNCDYKFDDFKYCMSIKGEDPEGRRKLWVRRRAEWWAQRRVGASSEDVWDARETPLENFPPTYPEDVANASNI